MPGKYVMYRKASIVVFFTAVLASLACLLIFAAGYTYFFQVNAIDDISESWVITDDGQTSIIDFQKVEQLQPGQKTSLQKIITVEHNDPQLLINTRLLNVKVFLGDQVLYIQDTQQPFKHVIIDLPDNYLNQTLTIQLSNDYGHPSLASSAILIGEAQAIMAYMIFTSMVKMLVFVVLATLSIVIGIAGFLGVLPAAKTHTLFFAWIIFISSLYFTGNSYLENVYFTQSSLVIINLYGLSLISISVLCFVFAEIFPQKNYQTICMIIIWVMLGNMLWIAVKGFDRLLPVWIFSVVNCGVALLGWRALQRTLGIGYHPLWQIIFASLILLNINDGWIHTGITYLYPVYTAMVVLMPCLLAVVYNYGQQLVREKNKQNQQRLNAMIQQHQIEQTFANIEDAYREIQSTQQTMQDFVRCADGYLEIRDELQLNRLIEQYLSAAVLLQQAVYCEHGLINLCLNSTIHQIKSQDIDVVIRADADQSIQIEDMDITSLLGNIFTNALEASLRITEVHQRKIQGDIYMDDIYLYINVRNRITHAVTKNHQRIMTSKANHLLHGHGTRVIQSIADKYEGIALFENDNHWFSVSVMLRKAKD